MTDATRSIDRRPPRRRFLRAGTSVAAASVLALAGCAAPNIQDYATEKPVLDLRSYFNGTFGYAHPQSVSGYYSTQLLQTMDSFVKEFSAGGLQSYTDVISKHSLDLR